MSPLNDNSTRPLVFWLLGALFTINLSFAGAVAASVNSRFNRDEDRLKEIEALSVDVGTLTARLDALKDSLSDLKTGQHDIDAKVGYILSTMTKDHETYNQLVKQYQDTLRTAAQNKR
jgi:hypothetical protein